MITPEAYQLLVAYHRWSTEILFKSVDPIPDADYRADHGLYFKSIHGTLNHLLLAELIWRGRLTGKPYPVTSLHDEVEANRAALKEKMLASADAWVEAARRTTEDQLKGNLNFRTIRGVEMSIPLWSVMLHGINHGTHHRGQISAVVTKLGFPVPEMDMLDLVRERLPKS